jgi:glycosyltransferase involved in cell wall biosynthesis
MKDHATFLRACARVVAARPRTRFVCVGDGPTPFATELAALSGGLGLAGSVLWSPARPDVAAVYSALDVHVSASYFGEGFSNAVAEAMACEVPSVATDIGDARQLVADAGRVVPPRDPVAMAEAVLGLLDAEPRALGLQGRARIEREYGVDRLVARTAALLQPLAGRRA